MAHINVIIHIILFLLLLTYYRNLAKMIANTEFDKATLKKRNDLSSIETYQMVGKASQELDMRYES